MAESGKYVEGQLVRKMSDQVQRAPTVFNVTRVATAFKRVLTSRIPDADEFAQVDPEKLRKEALQKSHNKFAFFSNASSKDIMLQLGTNPQTGLTTAEADARFAEHGPNELAKEPPKPFWRLLLEQFSDILVIMLIVASIVSLGLGEYKAAISIIVIIIANAVLGVVQESRAGAALDALESLSAPTTTVLRDGSVQEIDSIKVVPGDIVILELGKRISADLRLTETQGLVCGEMALTGESEGVPKDANFIGGQEKEEAKSEEPKKKKEEALTDKNMVYMGCTVHDGRGKGVVVKTGMQTKMGEIAHLLKTADKGMSPLQKKLHDLGTRLGIASICISIVVFVIGVATDRGTDRNSDQPVWLQMLLVAVSLTVAAVPEGLPACVTITLAIGMRKMVEKKALIRNLRSVETLGSASVICTDKTGTLTKGVMTAVRLWFCGETYRITGAGYDPSGHIVPEQVNDRDHQAVNAAAEKLKNGLHTRPLFYALLCSNARVQFDEKEKKWEAVGNSSERPLVVAAKKAGFEAAEMEKLFPRIKENPFNSARKMMSTFHDCRSAPVQLREKVLGEDLDAPYVSVVKGAPNFILKKCTKVLDDNGKTVRDITPTDIENIEKVMDHFSEQAFRVLAIAYRPTTKAEDTSPEALEQNLIFSGMVASIDPERPEVGPSIRIAANAGIRTVMITGDYVKTAKAIAENIGLIPRGSPDSKAVDCEIVRQLGGEMDELKKLIENSGGMDRTRYELELNQVEERLDAITRYADVYARAKPADKITIVRSLQRQGNICSMTGDGVNDAPALKQANIGVAMGITGTDVAKSASDMVLVDDNFCSIVDAIEQGRTIYANIQKFVFYLLSTNVAEVMTILLPVIIGLPSPLEPIQILWMNLATDGAPAIALAMENTEPGTMEQGPRPQTEGIVEKLMLTGIVIQVTLLTLLAFIVYIVGLDWELGHWDATKPEGMSESDYDKHVRIARTMVIVFISFAELLRAYSCRALRASIWTVGPFTNKVMQYAISISILATVFIANVPGVMGIFSLEYMSGKQWIFIIGMSLIPFTVDEFTKFIYRATGFGKRPTINNVEAAPHFSPNAPPSIIKKISNSLDKHQKLEDEKEDV